MASSNADINLTNNRLHRLSTTSVFVVALITMVSSAGCVSSAYRAASSIDAARADFALGNLDRARRTLTQIAQERGKNGDPAQLDLAMIELTQGDWSAAETRLRELRDRMDAAPAFSVAHGAAALLTDDTARIYRAAGHEQVMIRAMLALCSMAGDGIDAESYALQATTKQNQLKRAAEEKGVPAVDDLFQPIGLSHYLRGVLREATHHDYDDASREYRLVSAIEPQFTPVKADITRASSGVHSPPGHGVLYVIAGVGEGPRLRETVAPTTTKALSIASVLIRQAADSPGHDHRDKTRLPNIASVRIPQVIVPASKVSAVTVQIDHPGGDFFGQTQTITDVGQLAINQHQAERPWTIARAVARRVVKETAVTKLSHSLGLRGNAGSLFEFAAATVWAGGEETDTRCWGLLPRQFQVLRAELPAGDHVATLRPLGHLAEPVGSAVSTPVTINDGRNTYLVLFAPQEKVVIANSVDGD